MLFFKNFDFIIYLYNGKITKKRSWDKKRVCNKKNIPRRENIFKKLNIKP